MTLVVVWCLLTFQVCKLVRGEERIKFENPGSEGEEKVQLCSGIIL